MRRTAILAFCLALLLAGCLGFAGEDTPQSLSREQGPSENRTEAPPPDATLRPGYVINPEGEGGPIEVRALGAAVLADGRDTYLLTTGELYDQNSTVTLHTPDGGTTVGAVVWAETNFQGGVDGALIQAQDAGLEPAVRNTGGPEDSAGNVEEGTRLVAPDPTHGTLHGVAAGYSGITGFLYTYWPIPPEPGASILVADDLTLVGHRFGSFGFGGGIGDEGVAACAGCTNVVPLDRTLDAAHAAGYNVTLRTAE